MNDARDNALKLAARTLRAYSDSAQFKAAAEEIDAIRAERDAADAPTNQATGPVRVSRGSF